MLLASNHQPYPRYHLSTSCQEKISFIFHLNYVHSTNYTTVIHQDKAVKIKGYGGPEVLKIENYSVQQPKASEVLVSVHAVGLNRADCLQRRGLYPAPASCPQDIPGLEFAGVVRSCGKQATLYQPGDKVMGITGAGAMASVLVAHEQELIPIPEHFSFEEAAAIPEVFFTAYDALFEQAHLYPQASVLIHAVGSGVGNAALQLAHASKAKTIGTSRSKQKLQRSKPFGLDYGIHTENPEFLSALHSIFPTGVDLIIDTVGAKYAKENIKALRSQGTMITVGLLGGSKADIDLNLLLMKRINWVGSVLRSRSLEEKIYLTKRLQEYVIPLFKEGTIKPVLDCILPISEVGKAHELMETNQTFGKIVLTWNT